MGTKIGGESEGLVIGVCFIVVLFVWLALRSFVNGWCSLIRSWSPCLYSRGWSCSTTFRALWGSLSRVSVSVEFRFCCGNAKYVRQFCGTFEWNWTFHGPAIRYLSCTWLVSYQSSCTGKATGTWLPAFNLSRNVVHKFGIFQSLVEKGHRSVLLGPFVHSNDALHRVWSLWQQRLWWRIQADFRHRTWRMPYQWSGHLCIGSSGWWSVAFIWNPSREN